jgi:Fe-S cluster assembly scaffold protein SufB
MAAMGSTSLSSSPSTATKMATTAARFSSSRPWVVLLLSSLLLTGSPRTATCAFVIPTPTTATTNGAASKATGTSTATSGAAARSFHVSRRSPSTPLFVSVGLGPQKDESPTQSNKAGSTASVEDAPLVAGVDYVVPIHEDYRTSRRSKFDERCDAWFGGLLEASHPNDDESDDESSKVGCLGELAVQAWAALLAPVPLVNEFEQDDRNHPDWTPYVSTKLPWTPLTPSYGLEQYGMPIPRRGAEAWRQFDVNGLVAQPYATLMQCHLGHLDLDHVRASLESKGSWLSDDDCDGRLVYVNGQFVEALSKTTHDIYNLRNCPSKDSDLYKVLGRFTDGFTDELMDVDIPGVSEPLLSRLSGPNHKVGPAISQFAINTQQGTACFSALNTLKVEHVAVVRSSSSSSSTSTPASDDKESSSNDMRPVLVVQAFTSDAGLGAASTEAMSALGNVRLVVIGSESTCLSVQQCQVDLDPPPSQPTPRQHVPKLVNSYTQIMVHASANVSYALLDLVGGLVTPNVEAGDDDSSSSSDDSSSGQAATAAGAVSPRQVEAARPELRDTLFNIVDAHVWKNAALSYAGVQMGGSGRDRLAVSVSLLQSSASATLSGFCLSGGAQRCETKTCVHHVGGATTCRQVQKNLVGGRSTTSFRGRIRVEQDAQQTDAQQLSRSILLTDKARAWSVPSLEIIADDVKCSHGTTVSDLSEEELFYLTSRGIGRNTARKLLMYAFASDVCASVDVPFRESLRHQALARLENLVPQGGRAVKGEYQSI